MSIPIARMAFIATWRVIRMRFSGWRKFGDSDAKMAMMMTSATSARPSTSNALRLTLRLASLWRRLRLGSLGLEGVGHCSAPIAWTSAPASPEAAMTSSLVAVAGSNSRTMRPLAMTTIRCDAVSASPTSEVT